MSSVTKGASSSVDNGGGYDEWYNLTDIVSQNGITTEVYFSAGTSNFLKIYFGLNTGHVPSGSTIDGISFKLWCDGDSNSVKDNRIFLVKNGVVQTSGTNKANYTRWRFSSPFTYGANASISSTWGAGVGTITDSDVRNSAFGIAVEAVGDSGDTAYIDFAEINVWYTSSGGGGYFNGGVGPHTSVLLNLLN